MKFCHYIYELHPYLHPELNFKLEFPTRSWSFRVYFPCHHKSFAKNNNSVFLCQFSWLVFSDKTYMVWVEPAALSILFFAS